MYNCVWYFCTYPYGLSLNVWHALLCIANNRHAVTITTHATKRHFLIWMTTVRQPTKRRHSCVLTLKYTFICVYWWTRQKIHNTLIVVDRYLRLMGDIAIPDSAEPRLESFYPPFVTGIDLPHQGVVDSYNLHEIWCDSTVLRSVSVFDMILLIMFFIFPLCYERRWPLWGSWGICALRDLSHAHWTRLLLYAWQVSTWFTLMWGPWGWHHSVNVWLFSVFQVWTQSSEKIPASLILRWQLCTGGMKVRLPSLGLLYINHARNLPLSYMCFVISTTMTWLYVCRVNKKYSTHLDSVMEWLSENV